MTIRETMAPPIRLLLSIPEAAKSLGISRSRVYELVQKGAISTIKIGRLRRVPVVVLEAFVAQQIAEQGEGES